MSNLKKTKYDLEDRTAKFGKKIIEFAKKIPKTPITVPLTSLSYFDGPMEYAVIGRKG